MISKKHNTALIVLSALCFFYISAIADSFYLKEEGTTTAHGPYFFSNGSKIEINGKKYIVLTKKSGNSKPLTIQQKLKQTVLPSVQFREASIVDVLEYLRQASIQYSPQMPEDKKGINIIAKPQAKKIKASITFSAKDITLEETLNAVTRISGLRSKIDRNVLWIVPKQ